MKPKQSPKAVLSSSQDLKAKSFKFIFMSPSELLGWVRIIYMVSSRTWQEQQETKNSYKEMNSIWDKDSYDMRSHMDIVCLAHMYG